MIFIKALDKSLFLKSGDTLAVKMVRNLGPGTWQASLKGKLLTVTTRLSFKPGSVINVRALWDGDRLVLKMKGDMPDIPGETGLPADATAKTIIDAFFRSSMHLSPAKLQELYQFLKKHKITNRKSIRLIAIMMDKGLPLEKSLVNEMVSIIQGEGNQKRRNKERQGSEQHGEKDNQDNVEIVKTNQEHSENDTLRLFNHFRGSHDNWIIIPISVEHDYITIKGSIRCRLNEGGFSLGTVDIEVNGKPWQFSMKRKENNTFSLNIMESGNVKPLQYGDFLADFKEKLRNLGVELDDTISNAMDFDGFTYGLKDIYKTIDTVV